MTSQLKNTAEMSAALCREGLDALLVQIATRLDAFQANQPLSTFEVPKNSALPGLCQIFLLNNEEAELITLVAGCELNETLAQKLASINGTGVVDVALAVRLFGPGAWDMLCPEAALRRWHLIELIGNGPLRQREIRIDERIAQALLGNMYLDARLFGLIDRIGHVSAAGHSAAPENPVAVILRAWENSDRIPLILLGGKDRVAQRNVAAAVTKALRLQLFRLHACDIPIDASQRKKLAELADRELALSEAALLIEATADDTPNASALAAMLTGPTIVIADDPPLVEREPRMRLDLASPKAGARREIWRTALGARADALGPAIDQLAEQFTLDAASISTAVATAGDAAMSHSEFTTSLWQAARVQGRRALNGLADRVESNATWDDLVAPKSLTQTLRDISAQVRHAWRINLEWGWERKSPRGLGTAALFAGPSGTGKTLAAEVLANDLSLDLYRIDLSQVVSKYIGETEKNLSRIFAAAEDSGAVLLFDEADALFGKRSEVKDSHDRYANVEVSYLLQKMETYRGLAILTTNQKSALDTAFLRRLRYVLTFPFPDAAARVEIWRHVFPEETPSDGLNFEALSRLSIAGGSIRSIALNAAYLAAGSQSPVTMAHIRRAAMREYAKLEKPITAIEKGSFL